jgi:transposase
VVAKRHKRKEGSLMKKIRSYILAGKEVFVGLEDSKKSWKVCVRSGRMVIHETSMPAQYENLRNYFLNKFPQCKIRLMYEAGFRGFELHDTLVADGWECVVTPPHTVTQEKCSKQKNDRIDCRRLSKNLESGDYGACHVPERERREDRQVARLLGQVQKDVTRVCSRIRRTMEYHGLERYFPAGDWHPRQYREAEERTKVLPLSESLRFAFAMYFRELREVRALKHEILRRMRVLGRSERYRKAVELLRSAPGIGPLTGIRLALEWGDVSRFGRKEEFASFLGLIPSDYSTGEQDHKGHITKQGNRHVRWWLIESSWVAIRHDPVLLEKYRNVVSHTGSGKKAIVAVARKLAMRLRAILLSGEPYQVGLVEC